ncbi:MAG: Gfo/Idh/MocA family oxidoreductase [Acidobacteria bacterium]|nr:Gfo/Idh/MocA family oxidoreductase [Acidobacteriota bacterium]
MTNPESKITVPKLGFLGVGFAKKVQIPAFLMAGGCEIVSLASARLESAEATAGQFGVPHFTDDWRETIDHPDVDLVCITTPPNLHCEQALYAAARGKHILCEKPMAMNVAEAEAMCRAARDANVLALIDHELRFQTGRRKAREMLREGAIGKIRHVKYSFRNAMRGDVNVPWNWWSDKDAGGGTLGAIGSHAIDSLLWFLDTGIASVSCQLQTHVKRRTDSNGRLREVTTDDEALLNFRFADSELTDDTTGTMSLSMIEYPDYEHSIEFVGTDGSIRVLFLGEVLLTRSGDTGWTKIDVTIGESVPGLFDSGFPNAFVAFAPKILDAVRSGATTVEGAATFEDGLRVQQILDAARESDRSGRLVSLESD